MADIKKMIGIEGQAGHPALCVLPEIEKEDELFEIIWTLREDGRLSLDQIVQNCTLTECEKILKDLAASGWIELKGQSVELLRRVRPGPGNSCVVIGCRSGCSMISSRWMVQKQRRASSSTFCLLR